MIQDSTVLKELRKDWNGVEVLRGKFVRDGFARTAGSSGAHFPFSLVNAAHTLRFIHACSVLNDALEQLRDEGHFKCHGRTLGLLVGASKDLSWKNYSLIKDKVVKSRNGIAHDGNILGRVDCYKYIEAVEKELISWEVLPPSIVER